VPESSHEALAATRESLEDYRPQLADAVMACRPSRGNPAPSTWWSNGARSSPRSRAMAGRRQPMKGHAVKLEEYVIHDAVVLASSIRDRQVTGSEVIAAAREAIDAVNPQVDAVVETAGLPVMSGPLSFAVQTGLPFGSELVARAGREDLLFQLAGQLERATPWIHRRPPVWPVWKAA
jgi:hypothetical protein